MRRRRDLVWTLALVVACGEPSAPPEPTEPTGSPIGSAGAALGTPPASSTAEPATVALTAEAEATDDEEEPVRDECWSEVCLARMDEIVAVWTLQDALGLPDPESEPIVEAAGHARWAAAAGIEASTIPAACDVEVFAEPDCVADWEVTPRGVTTPETGCATAAYDVQLVVWTGGEARRIGAARRIESDFMSVTENLVDLDCADLPPSDDAIRTAIRAEPELARALADELDLPSDPASMARTDALALAFLRAAHQRAETAYRSGDHELAGDLALAALRAAPVATDRDREAGEGEMLFSCRASACTILPATRSTILWVNDLAFFALGGGRSGALDTIADILRSVVANDPDRAAARLNLADALWGGGHRDEAVGEYRRYVELRRGAVPERVRDRIAPSEAPAVAEVESLDDGRRRLTRTMGTLAGGEVSVETTTEDGGSGYQVATVVLRWRSGETTHETTVLDQDIRDISADDVLGTIEGSEVELRFPSSVGRFEDPGLEVQRWAYRMEIGTFERLSTREIPSDWEDGLADFHAAARAGELERAWGIRAAIGTTGTGGHVMEDEAMEWSMFAGRLVVAARLESGEAGTMLRFAALSLARTREEMETNYARADPIVDDHVGTLEAAIRALRRLGGDENEAAATRLESWPVVRSGPE